MKIKQQHPLNQIAVENFIGSLDMDMKIEDHFKNALNDSLSYDWSSATLREIFLQIEQKYLEKGDK